MVVDATTIRLSGREYALLTEQEASGLKRHRWHVESKRQATTIIPRPDVRPGDTEDEFVVTWDRFDKGIAGSHETLPGTTYIAEDCNGFTGALRPNSASTSIAQTTNDEQQNPAIVVVFNQIVFHFRGRYVYRYQDGAETQDVDFGSGVYATDAAVHNDELVAAMNSTNNIRSRNTAGTWTTATDNVDGMFFAKVEDRLWEAVNVNEVRNIGPTDNPLTLANWSTAITVGDDDYVITDLNAYGERLVVSKVNGMFIGDRGAIFPNVLPEFEATPDVENGRGTFSRGADLFYPHAGGLVRYNGFSREEVGIDQYLRTADTADLLPGTRIRGLAADGDYLWAACQLSGYGRADPTGFQKTTDNGVNYTNYTTEVGDNDLTTVADLSSLNTVANGDWFIVGYSAAFYGVWLELDKVNTSGGVILTLEYWNGSAWTAMPAGSGMVDGTIALNVQDGITGQALGRSGYVTWINSGLGTWAASTINLINAFWIRFSINGAFDAGTRVAEARVLTQEPRGWLYRGRPRRADDVRNTSIIWESYGPVPSIPYPQILVTSEKSPHNRGRQLQVAGKQISYFFRLPPNDVESNFQETASGFAVLPKHDGGLPFVNKQWTQLNLKGRTLSSDRDVALAYRTDENTSFTNVDTAIIASPSSNALSSVTGRAIQPRITFGAFADDVFTEVNWIEAVFRALWLYKEEYMFTLRLDLDAYNDAGGSLPAADVQLTNLEALRGSTVALVFPGLFQSKTVTVFEIGEAELFQTEHNHPALAVQLRCCEV